MSGQAPHCCHMGCGEPADFAIYGETGFEDVTEACRRHVGDLLGTPQGAKRDNQVWRVYALQAARSGRGEGG